MRRSGVDAEWMTLEEAMAELNICKGLMHTRLVSPVDDPFHLEGIRAANGYNWAGISRRTVAAYQVAQVASRMARKGNGSAAARRTWKRTVSLDEPRCPKCTALVEHEGDLCELCDALGDGPYYQFRPAVDLPAVVWERECVVNL